MKQRWCARPQSLRERPPGWPEEEDLRGGRRGSRREPDMFGRSGDRELYPGAMAMDDLANAADDVACTRILARYTVLRVFLLSGAGWLVGARLRLERRVALEHLALLPEHDWERQVLSRLNELCRETPAPAIVPAAVIAAEAAAKRGHVLGAFALYRAAFELGRRRAWWAEAGTAARGIARLAGVHDAPHSEQLWARRARVLERRVEREIAAEAAEEGDGYRRRV